MKVSVFFPAYNEEKNIEKILHKTIEVMKKNNYTYEIGIVNDGSRDSTAERVLLMQQTDDRIKLINHPRNFGYAAATRTSFQNASGDVICVIDADDQYDLEEIPLLLSKIEEGFDLVVGYRKRIRDSTYRKILSKGYNFIFKILFLTRFRDIDCGFRAIKKNAAEKISIKHSNVPVGAELFVRAFEKKLKIGQIPITHKFRVAGKSTFKFWKMPKTIFKIFMSVLLLRLKG